jgi:hypothetical protein
VIDRRGHAGAVFAISFAMMACASAEAPEARAPEPHGDPVLFSYIAVDGSSLDSQGTRGRATVVLFFTSYDMASQMLARRLEELRRQHTPRINVIGVALEAPKYDLLVSAFGESLGLGYPLVMADRGTLSGRGPFGEVRGVPTVVVLNRQGREVWRRQGAPSNAELHEALAAAGAAQRIDESEDFSR